MSENYDITDPNKSYIPLRSFNHFQDTKDLPLPDKSIVYDMSKEEDHDDDYDEMLDNERSHDN